MPLHPQVGILLGQMREAGAVPFETMSVREAREAAGAFAAMTGEPEPINSVRHRFITGPTADLPIAVFTPDGGGPFPGLVYFHGSGWVLLNLDVVDAPLRAVANRAGCVIVAVNYQKAPEHKFPIPLDDCYAATEWVAAHAGELDIDPGRLAVGGDDAGGNLAAAVCLRARDEHGPALRYQLLIYPVTDYNFETPSYIENGEGLLLQRDTMRWFWQHYLPAPVDGANPLCSPLRAADLEGLPPALVITAEFDPFRDEGEAFGERLRAAGVPVKISRYDGMIHGFFYMAGVLDEAKRVYDEIAVELKSAVGA